jgi:hypothetical protein
VELLSADVSSSHAALSAAVPLPIVSVSEKVVAWLRMRTGTLSAHDAFDELSANAAAGNAMCSHAMRTDAVSADACSRTGALHNLAAGDH